MLNTQEEIYLKGLTEQYYKNDYKNYICYTNNPNNIYNQSYVDIYCYYSKNEITNKNNKYQIPNNSIKCELDTKNSTSTYKLDSKVCNNYNGEINPSSKEFIYSNVGNNANIIEEYETQYNLKLNIELYSMAILITLILMFLYKFIRGLLRG